MGISWHGDFVHSQEITEFTVNCFIPTMGLFSKGIDNTVLSIPFHLYSTDCNETFRFSLYLMHKEGGVPTVRKLQKLVNCRRADFESYLIPESLQQWSSLIADCQGQKLERKFHIMWMPIIIFFRSNSIIIFVCSTWYKVKWIIAQDQQKMNPSIFQPRFRSRFELT